MMDFRNQGRIANLQANLGSLRSAIASAKQYLVLKCGAPVGAIPTYKTILYNNYVSPQAGDIDWSKAIFKAGGSTGNCPASEDNQRLYDGVVNSTWQNASVLPASPFDPYQPAVLFVIWGDCIIAKCGCQDLGGFYLYPWAYNQQSGQIWPATNVMGECDL